MVIILANVRDGMLGSAQFMRYKRLMLLNCQGFEMVEKLWFGTATCSFGLFGWLISTDATRSANSQRYSFWFSPLSLGAYVAAAVGIVAAVSGLFCLRKRWLREQVGVIIRDPSSSVQGDYVLGERQLRTIRKMASARAFSRVQKQAMLAYFRGKKIKVQGTVVDVGEWSGSSSYVTLRTRMRLRRFTAHLAFSDMDTFDRLLSILVPKQEITVVGEIQRMEKNSISLTNCEILSVVR